MNRTEKHLFVSSLHQVFEKNSLVVIIKQSGMTVTESSDLRSKIRSVNAGYKVAKNKLVKLALKETEHEALSKFFEGPTSIAFSEDPIAAAKIVIEYINTNKKMQVVAAGLNGKVLDAEQVQNLAKLPSLDGLRAILISLIQAPATKIASILQAPGSQIARVLKAHSQNNNN